MKNYVSRWEDAVWASALGSSEKLVALAMAKHADYSTGANCRPGPATLAAMTGLSDSTVVRCRRNLESAGWVARSSTGGLRGEKRSANVYHLTNPGHHDPGHGDTGGTVTPVDYPQDYPHGGHGDGGHGDTGVTTTDDRGHGDVLPTTHDLHTPPYPPGGGDASSADRRIIEALAIVTKDEKPRNRTRAANALFDRWGDRAAGWIERWPGIAASQIAAGIIDDGRLPASVRCLEENFDRGLLDDAGRPQRSCLSHLRVVQ